MLSDGGGNVCKKMITKIISTMAVLLELIVILVIRSRRDKTGSVRLEKSGEGRFVVLLAPISRWIAYTAYAVGGIVCLCAALEKTRGDILYGFALGSVFLCAAPYWVVRCFRWKVELSGERIYCRGTLGRAKVFSWSEVRTAKMQFEYVRVCGEVMVQFDDTKGRSVRFPIPALYADEVGALIKSHPKVIFNSTQNKSSMNFKI